MSSTLSNRYCNAKLTYRVACEHENGIQYSSVHLSLVTSTTYPPKWYTPVDVNCMPAVSERDIQLPGMTPSASRFGRTILQIVSYRISVGDGGLEISSSMTTQCFMAASPQIGCLETAFAPNQCALRIRSQRLAVKPGVVLRRRGRSWVSYPSRWRSYLCASSGDISRAPREAAVGRPVALFGQLNTRCTTPCRSSNAAGAFSRK